MEMRHPAQRELAERRRISGATLDRWRREGVGPDYLKLQGRALCRLVDVEAREASCLRSTTAGQPLF